MARVHGRLSSCLAALIAVLPMSACKESSSSPVLPPPSVEVSGSWLVHFRCDSGCERARFDIDEAEISQSGYSVEFQGPEWKGPPDGTMSANVLELSSEGLREEDGTYLREKLRLEAEPDGRVMTGQLTTLATASHGASCRETCDVVALKTVQPPSVEVTGVWAITLDCDDGCGDGGEVMGPAVLIQHGFRLAVFLEGEPEYRGVINGRTATVVDVRQEIDPGLPISREVRMDLELSEDGRTLTGRHYERLFFEDVEICEKTCFLEGQFDE